MKWTPPDNPDKWVPPDIPEEPATLKSIGLNAVKDVSDFGEQTNLFTGNSTNPITAPYENIINRFNETKKTADMLAGQPLKERFKTVMGMEKNIGEGLVKPYIHPIESFKERPISTLAAWTPALDIAGETLGFKGMPKIAGEPLKTGETSISNSLAGKLDESSLENVATRPYVREFAKDPNIIKNKKELLVDAVNTVQKLPEQLQKVKTDLYKKVGVKDTTPVNAVNDWVTNDMTGKNESIIKGMQNAVEEYRANGSVPKESLESAEMLIKEIKDNTNKNGDITFGQVKGFKNRLWDMAQKELDQNDKLSMTGQLYNDMRQHLRSAETQIPQLGEARTKYKDLIDAEDKIKHSLKTGLHPDETNLGLKILRRRKAAEHSGYIKLLDDAETILKKYPETQDLAVFNDKIKTAQLAADLQHATGQTGLQLNPITTLTGMATRGIRNLTKVFDPKFQVNMLARGVDKGVINPEALTGKIKSTMNPIYGSSVTSLRALMNAFNKPPKVGGLAGLRILRGENDNAKH